MSKSVIYVTDTLHINQIKKETFAICNQQWPKSDSDQDLYGVNFLH